MFKSFFLLRKYYKKHENYDMPFIPSNNRRVKTMFKLADIKTGEKSLDLGAGDGKVVIAFAEAGAIAYGIEIDEILTELARHNIKKKRLENKAQIINGDMWKIQLGDYDIITIYGLTSVLYKLEEKIQSETKKGCRIICNYFHFPHLTPVKVINDVYLYINR